MQRFLYLFFSFLVINQSGYAGSIFSSFCSDTVRYSEITPGSLAGAELSYHSLSETEIEIRLLKFFQCTEFKVDSHETVNFKESLLTGIQSRPILKLSYLSDTTLNLNVNCNQARNCVRKAIYTARVKIMNPMMGGYDISWAYCCWNDELKNIKGFEELTKQGLALICHVGETAPGQKNSSPDFISVPVLHTCKNQMLIINVGVNDLEGDSVAYELSPLYSYKSANGNPIENEPSIVSGQPVNMSVPGALPPFALTIYKKGFSYKAPFGEKQAEFNNFKGELQIKPKEPGEYLISLSVNEYRSGKLMSSKQRVFKIRVHD